MTPPTANDVRSFLLDHFASTFAANGLTPEDLGDDFDLLKAGVVDSLGVIEMIAEVEKHFRITVDFGPMDPAELTLLEKFSHFVAQNAIQSDLPP